MAKVNKITLDDRAIEALKCMFKDEDKKVCFKDNIAFICNAGLAMFDDEIPKLYKVFRNLNEKSYGTLFDRVGQGHGIFGDNFEVGIKDVDGNYFKNTSGIKNGDKMALLRLIKERVTNPESLCFLEENDITENNNIIVDESIEFCKESQSQSK